MKLYGPASLANLLPVLHRVFPRKYLNEVAARAARGDYRRRVELPRLFYTMIGSIILRMPGREAIVDRYHHQLGSSCQQTLSYWLSNPAFARFLHELVAQLERQKRPRGVAKRCPLAAIDSMNLVVGHSQRGDAPHFNNHSKGLSIQWAINLAPAKGEPLVSLHHIIHGACNDSFRVRFSNLNSNVRYLMDRGFYSITTIALWLEQNISFVVRVKSTELKSQCIKVLSRPRKLKGGITLQADELVVLGSLTRRTRPKVRLIRAWLPKQAKAHKNGHKRTGQQDLFLATDDFKSSAEELLGLYRWRHQIEVYHRFLKHCLGLGHLYSLGKTGMEVMVLLVVILTNLLWLRNHANPESPRAIVQQLTQVLKKLRKALGLYEIQRRNVAVRTRHQPRYTSPVPT